MKEKKRVLLVLRRMAMGGIEQATRTLARTLQSAGHEAHLLVLKGPVPTTLVRMRLPGGAVLLEDADGAPMLFGKPLGRGKVVQWLVSPKIWLRQHFGHTFGLDGVWLRSRSCSATEL